MRPKYLIQWDADWEVTIFDNETQKSIELKFVNLHDIAYIIRELLK